MYRIAIIEEFHKSGLDLFDNNKSFSYEIITDTSEENLIKKLPNFDGCTLRVSKLNKSILEKCPKLKVISRHGVGYDNVDLDFLNENKIALCITSTSNAVSVAEHVLSFFIYLTKKLSLSDSLVKEGNFEKRSKLPNFFELYKKKVLIKVCHSTVVV